MLNYKYKFSVSKMNLSQGRLTPSLPSLFLFCVGFCVYRVLQTRSDTSACRPLTVYSSSFAPTLNAKADAKYMLCSSCI